jgi:small-conductance mechanosensitive channel
MLEAYAATTQVTDVANSSVYEIGNLVALVITRIPLWISGLVVIILSFGVASIVRSRVESKLAEKGIEDEHKELQVLGGRMSYVVIITLGITVGLKIAGIDLTTVIAAIGFGVGFALKDMIMNFLAGIMILLGRHFTIGDYIQINGKLGKVIEIQSRVTILQAIDGTKVIVPNADIFSNTVISYTSNPFRRIEIVLGMPYGCDLENAMKVLLSGARKTKGVLVQPKPTVIITEYGDSAITVKVRVWVESRSAWLKIKGNLIINLNKTMEKYGIDQPYPIQTIIFDKDEKKLEEKMIEEEDEPNKTPAQAPVQMPVMAVQTPQLAVQPVVIDDDDEQPLKPLGEK